MGSGRLGLGIFPQRRNGQNQRKSQVLEAREELEVGIVGHEDLRSSLPEMMTSLEERRVSPHMKRLGNSQCPEGHGWEGAGD